MSGARNGACRPPVRGHTGTMSLVDGLQAAPYLDGYQRGLDRAVTSRLHAYLPLTSLGVPVEFKVGSPGDVRLAGLTGLHPGDARLREMRDGIRDLIATVFREGGDRSRRGRGLRPLARDHPRSGGRGQAHDSTRRRPIRPPPSTCPRPSRQAERGAGGSGRTTTVDRETVTDVVLAFDQNLTFPAAVLRGVDASRTRPARYACGCSVAGCRRRRTRTGWRRRSRPSR